VAEPLAPATPLQLLPDAADGYCDPVTGTCAVPGPAAADDEPTADDEPPAAGARD